MIYIARIKSISNQVNIANSLEYTEVHQNAAYFAHCKSSKVSLSVTTKTYHTHLLHTEHILWLPDLNIMIITA
nr:MAG TPA: hypothetical protein [Caudoviricetes sp.]